MTMTSEDVELRVRRGRDRPLTVLADLDPDGGRPPRLCAGWAGRDPAAHQHGVPVLDRPGSRHGGHARELPRCLSKSAAA